MGTEPVPGGTGANRRAPWRRSRGARGAARPGGLPQKPSAGAWRAPGAAGPPVPPPPRAPQHGTETSPAPGSRRHPLAVLPVPCRCLAPGSTQPPRPGCRSRPQIPQPGAGARCRCRARGWGFWVLRGLAALHCSTPGRPGTASCSRRPLRTPPGLQPDFFIFYYFFYYCSCFLFSPFCLKSHSLCWINNNNYKLWLDVVTV